MPVAKAHSSHPDLWRWGIKEGRRKGRNMIACVSELKDKQMTAERRFTRTTYIKHKACSYPSTRSNLTTLTHCDTVIWIVTDLHTKNFEVLEVLKES
jgi:hypothetical protein